MIFLKLYINELKRILKMKYKRFKQIEKKPTTGGDYWRDADFQEHLKLTYYQTTYKFLLKHYPPPRKILEAGCGLGRWVIALSKDGYDVTGIEIHEEALNIIKTNYKANNLTLVHGDIFKMNFPDESFDAITSLGVLEHLEDMDILKEAILEHKRVLEKNGIFLITVPYLSLIRGIFHIPFVKLLSLVRYLKKKKQFFSEYRYGKNEFQKIIEECQLKVIDVVYDDLLPPYNFGLMDYPIRKICKDNKAQYRINNLGIFVFKLFWHIHPKLVSGGIGFVCKRY
jgi:ubiquinone/menaquinone biosynthesis C-methylase UbiE